MSETTYCKHCEHRIEWGRDATVNFRGVVYHTLCWGQAMHSYAERLADSLGLLRQAALMATPDSSAVAAQIKKRCDEAFDIFAEWTKVNAA